MNCYHPINVMSRVESCPASLDYPSTRTLLHVHLGQSQPRHGRPTTQMAKNGWHSTRRTSVSGESRRHYPGTRHFPSDVGCMLAESPPRLWPLSPAPGTGSSSHHRSHRPYGAWHRCFGARSSSFCSSCSCTHHLVTLDAGDLESPLWVVGFGGFLQEIAVQWAVAPLRADWLQIAVQMVDHRDARGHLD